MDQTKEQVYDAKIFPLMAQIIEICKRAKIPMVANFQLSLPGEEDLRCTTALIEKEYGPSKDQELATDLFFNGYMALITVKK